MQHLGGSGTPVLYIGRTKDPRLPNHCCRAKPTIIKCTCPSLVYQACVAHAPCYTVSQLWTAPP